ncbi:phospholipase A2 inhibitor and Ly6/PLAUR domain-containing protein-like [Leptodactylus fuscus]|uniref:phospholipase A2 inhibitor and Ly6/PLAUR domain-containing protein-like n=1 Tax=Leptodactylus fuscus TaxID=238119 RepID=UPI003F4E8CB7
MELLGILLLLSALTTTGYSLICKTCWHLSSLPCNGSYVSCPTGQVCVAAFTSVNIGGAITPQYSITCGKPNDCNVTGSMTMNIGKILTGTSCCNTDNCTPPFPALPSVSLQKNGLTCRTCASDQSDYCYTSDKLQCTGQETKCARMARTLSGTINLKDALRGCATKSYCDILGSQNAFVDGLYVDMKTYCSDGAADLRHMGYFMLICTVAMTKFMF